MKNIIVLDIETKNDFAEVGGRENMHLLEISVVGMYSYNKDEFFVLRENELDKLKSIVQEASLIIGFNIKGFDFPVMKKHLNGIDIEKLPLLDLMDQPRDYLKFRPSLNALTSATFKKKKIADGLEAIKMYRDGRMDELEKYCLDDVKLTRDLYEYGKKEGKVMFFDFKVAGEYAIPVSWGEDNQNQKSSLGPRNSPNVSVNGSGAPGAPRQKSLF